MGHGSLTSYLLAAATVFGCIHAAPAPPLANDSRAASTFSLQFHKVSRPTGIMERGGITATLTGDAYETRYFVTVGIGTPVQQLYVQLDTGSSNTWVYTPAACASVSCVGGSFDSSRSSTFRTIMAGAFMASYIDGTVITGDMVTDNLKISGQTISALAMGLGTASSGNSHNGVMGLGFDTNEGNFLDYRNVLDDMVTQGLIASKRYSLWLDSLEANHGTVLFGGLDESKYQGNMHFLNMIPDSNGVYREFFVRFTSISIIFANRSPAIEITYPSFSVNGLLDSGNTYIDLPTQIYNQIASNIGVASDGTIACSAADNGGSSLNFGFPGVTIQVPFSELVYQSNGVCTLRVQAVERTYATFGDYFLRSAYVVYDLQHKKIGLAQTVFS